MSVKSVLLITNLLETEMPETMAKHKYTYKIQEFLAIEQRTDFKEKEMITLLE